MKRRSIPDSLSSSLVRLLFSAAIILAGIFFLTAINWHVESVPSTALTAKANIISPAQRTATTNAAVAGTAGVQASDSSMVEPTQIVATPTITGSMLPLLGRRIGIDPGHGPREDIGAVLTDPD